MKSDIPHPVFVEHLREGGGDITRLDQLPRHKRTQKRIQLFVPNLRFLLLFRGVFALLRHERMFFDIRSQSCESFCAFDEKSFLFPLKFWVIVQFMVFR